MSHRSSTGEHPRGVTFLKVEEAELSRKQWSKPASLDPLVARWCHWSFGVVCRERAHHATVGIVRTKHVRDLRTQSRVKRWILTRMWRSASTVHRLAWSFLAGKKIVGNIITFMPLNVNASRAHWWMPRAFSKAWPVTYHVFREPAVDLSSLVARF